MPGSSGVFSLRQIFVLLIVVALTVLLVRQVTWHALLVGTGGILFAAAVGIYVFFPSRKGYERPGRAFRHGRGTGLWCGYGHTARWLCTVLALDCSSSALPES